VSDIKAKTLNYIVKNNYVHKLDPLTNSTSPRTYKINNGARIIILSIKGNPKELINIIIGKGVRSVSIPPTIFKPSRNAPIIPVPLTADVSGFVIPDVAVEKSSVRDIPEFAA